MSDRFVDYLAELEAPRPRRRRATAPRVRMTPTDTGPRVAFAAPPPADAAKIVRTGIERQRRTDEQRRRAANLAVLLQRVQAVADADAQQDAIVLRAALVDVAAVAERWAAELPGGKRA